SDSATTAGVNGDLFNPVDGHPSGILMRSGALEHTPLPGRSSIGIDSQGNLHVDRVALIATWQGTGQRRPVATVNEPARPNSVTLFTPASGPNTPASPGTIDIALAPFPALTPNTPVSGPGVTVAQTGRVASPPNGPGRPRRGSS